MYRKNRNKAMLFGSGKKHVLTWRVLDPIPNAAIVTVTAVISQIRFLAFLVFE